MSIKVSSEVVARQKDAYCQLLEVCSKYEELGVPARVHLRQR